LENLKKGKTKATFDISFIFLKRELTVVITFCQRDSVLSSVLSLLPMGLEHYFHQKVAWRQTCFRPSETRFAAVAAVQAAN
jgi:hypothetical protein